MPGDRSERYPCLVDLSTVTAVDQVWATDITHIPTLYLVAILDLVSRNVLSWELCNSLDTEFCLEALEMAVSQGSSTSIKAVSSPPPTSWPACRLSGSGSAGPAESAAATTFWWRDCGVRSNMRRSTCGPTVTAGRRRSACPASCGGAAMEGRTVPWEAKLPMRSTLRPSPVHSLPGGNGPQCRQGAVRRLAGRGHPHCHPDPLHQRRDRRTHQPRHHGSGPEGLFSDADAGWLLDVLELIRECATPRMAA